MCCKRFAGNTGRKNDAKIHNLRTIAQLCRAISSQLRQASTIGKKLLNISISPTCPYNMANFGPLWLRSVQEFGHSSYFFQRVSRLGSVTARHSSSGRQPNFAALNGRAAITLGNDPYSSSFYLLLCFFFFLLA